jgi:hypothetical protein
MIVVSSHSTPVIDGGAPELINIRLTGRVTASVTVSNQDPISVLLKESPQKSYKLVYNGTILNPSLSFSFYGITQRDLIYVISPQTKEVVKTPPVSQIPDLTKHIREHFDRNWAHRTNDTEATFQRFKDSVDKVTCMENARLVDIKRSKMEANPSQYRKVCQRFEKMVEREASTKIQTQQTSDSVKTAEVKLPFMEW